jgi:hypothetical protein
MAVRHLVLPLGWGSCPQNPAKRTEYSSGGGRQARSGHRQGPKPAEQPQTPSARSANGQAGEQGTGDREF